MGKTALSFKTRGVIGGVKTATIRCLGKTRKNTQQLFIFTRISQQFFLQNYSEIQSMVNAADSWIRIPERFSRAAVMTLKHANATARMKFSAAESLLETLISRLDLTLTAGFIMQRGRNANLLLTVMGYTLHAAIGLLGRKVARISGHTSFLQHSFKRLAIPFGVTNVGPKRHSQYKSSKVAHAIRIGIQWV